MYTKCKNGFWAFCLLVSFPLYAIGQIMLLAYDQTQRDFYLRLTKDSSGWVAAHLIVMLSLIMMIPAFIAIGAFLKNRKHPIWFGLSFFFTILFLFVMFGQYTIDLCLVEVFKLPRDQAHFVLERIQSNPVVEALFFDNSRLFHVLRYLDFWFLGQICLAGAFLVARKLPLWALTLFFMAMILTELGPLLFPVFGKTVRLLGYVFYSPAYVPIAVHLFKNKNNRNALQKE